ncbi:pyridoxamine 5'-phosphate oxidase [Pseudonocardia spinosispora]|uniref:pyridoxamine 5'-phosphate oxidase n=1 Tax=Pseudonocardia spinosispora TaxID=103441 RepID=UPI00048CB3CA|nr:pyridoxamine 5'-phosphate oxidase [Pseudonocardia spinosispora]
MSVDRMESRAVAAETSFDAGDLAATWHEQLHNWLADAVEAQLPEPNAMVLATADLDGAPSSRSVLCKTIDQRGIVFFTNYTSAKSRDLRSNQRAAVTFPWYGLHRQVNLRGTVTEVRQSESEAYWATRPRGSQLGAWASPQSVIMSSRKALDDSLDAVTHRYADAEQIPLPRHWGGWLIRPERVEFWQGRPNRMHDRLAYDRTAHNNSWTIHRLAP